jgi:uncharacterized membrane protein
MSKGRLEAFSDGVIAIILTIMVLELRAPESADPSGLAPLVPVFMSYVMSFVFMGIYWTNHHHLFQIVRLVDGRILWANLHLLFWLSLTPFVTSWMGDTHFARVPVVAYGAVLFASGIAYWILTSTLLARHGKDSPLAAALGRDFKGKISIVLYAVGILGALLDPRISCAFYVFVALMWLVPDRRIEKVLANSTH